MSKTLENQGFSEQSKQEFPNLGKMVRDVRKELTREEITPSNPKYETLLDSAIRKILLNLGILEPGQPSREKQLWFEKIKEALTPDKAGKDWEILSAQSINQEKSDGLDRLIRKAA